MTDDYDPLSDRDKAVVRLVGKFGQMTARQIGEVLFAEQASRTPCDRCLKRLTDRGYLSRLELRVVGGITGGSSQFVYQVGRAGWRFLNRQGRYWAHRSVNHHAIELAEVYVKLKILERAGEVKVLRFDVEHEAWRTVDDVQLTPDAYLELASPEKRALTTHFIELDRGTENTNRLRQKMDRYWQAYQSWQGEYFPTVVFVVPDEHRKQEIESIVAGGPPDVPMFLRASLQSDAKTYFLSHPPLLNPPSLAP